MTNHLKSITPLTIEAIRAWEFCGNAWSDGLAFKSIDEFVLDGDKPAADRAEALRVMGRNGMGLTDEEMGIAGKSDEQQVLEYYHAACEARGTRGNPI
jgi:hypothetical protein